MDQSKLAQQLFNLSKEIYHVFYYTVFLQVCSSYSIIPDGFTTNKGELSNLEAKFHDLVPYEEAFNCLFEELLIQGDWLLKVRGHLEKYKKTLGRRKSKKLRKLTKSNDFCFLNA